MRKGLRKRLIGSFLLIAIFFSIPLLVAETDQARNRQRMAEQALDGLRQAYAGEDSEGFFGLVSERPYLNWTDLKFKVMDYFSNYSEIDLTISIDQTLAEGNKVHIKAQWLKRAVNNNTGKVEVFRGSAEFLFLVKEKAKLIDIKGQSPF